MLFLGDIYFSTNNLIEMVELFYKSNLNSVLAVKEDENEEAIKRNFAVILNEESTYVRRVIEKPRYVSNTIKGCGLYLLILIYLMRFEEHQGLQCETNMKLLKRFRF